MTILTLYDNSGPKYHRLLLPLSLMPGIEFKVSGVLNDELCHGIDILFINRMVFGSSIQQMEELRTKHGFKIVIDFDDHWSLDTKHVLFDMYHARGYTEAMIYCLKIADAVTVTHDRLAEEARQYNSNVHILPNAIPHFGQFTVKKTEDELTRLFWAGSDTHERDINLLFEPVKEFRSLPVKMVMGGYKKSPVNYRMRNAYTRYGKLPHELIEAIPVENYYYAYSKCDIALIPLEQGWFNTFKSNLKILEAANIGANVVVSNVHPYKDVPGVEYVNEPGDWFKNVKRLIEDNDYAKQQSTILQEYCSEHFNFEKINKERCRILTALV